MAQGYLLQLNASASSAGAPQWIKVTKTFSDLAIAGLTNDITLYTLAAREYIHDIKIIPTTAFSGGLIATYTLSVGITGSLLKYAAVVDVFTGNISLSLIHTPISGLESTFGTTDLKLSAVSTVGNLNAATAGSVDIYILTSILP